MRVTVTSEDHRADLVLPGSVPVAELVPGLARSVGLLDGLTAHLGYRLVTHEGVVLDTDRGLACQGVEDGTVLEVLVADDGVDTRVYDDVVEAMGDIVERDLPRVDPATVRRAAWWAATLVLLVGAGCLALAGRSHRAAWLALFLAVVPVLVAALHSRMRGEAEGPVLLAVVACAYAAAAGVQLGGGLLLTPVAISVAGGAVVTIGALAAGCLVAGRMLLVPPVVTGAVVLTSGLAAGSSATGPATLLTTVLALAVVAGSTLPGVALGVAGATVGPLVADPQASEAVVAVDVVRLAAKTRLAHEIVTSSSVTIGVLLVLLSPCAVSLGLAGAVVAALSCLLVTLRGCRQRATADLVVGLASGVLGLVSTAVSACWLHPEWRMCISLAVVTCGAGLLARALLPPSGSLRGARVAELVECVSLTALLPALAVATDLLSAVESWAGR